jgi:hypothetical protein
MRRAGSLLVLLLLLLPAWDSLPPARSTFQLWTKLRARHRDAPDTVWDRYYSQLTEHLPAKGRVGLVQVLTPGTPAQQHEYYTLQYALAPRILMPGSTEEYVVACGPAATLSTLLDASKFVVVKRFEDDFTLFRRTKW